MCFDSSRKRETREKFASFFFCSFYRCCIDDRSIRAVRFHDRNFAPHKTFSFVGASTKEKERIHRRFLLVFQFCIDAGIAAEINKLRLHNSNVVASARRRVLRAAFNFNISLSAAAVQLSAVLDVDFSTAPSSCCLFLLPRRAYARISSMTPIIKYRPSRDCL